jgi:hypothetical protein
MCDIHASIDGLAAVDVEGMPAAALGAHIRALMTARDRLDGQIGRALQVFDARGYCQSDGAPSTASWLRGRSRITSGEASLRVKTARGLRELPATAQALEDGAITLAHARAIAMLAHDTDLATTRQIEIRLIELARLVDPVRFSCELRLIREAYTRDGSDGKDNEKPDDPDDEYRRLSVVASFEGRFNLNGWLTPEGGAMLKAALDALARPLPDDERTTTQRYADALVELARRQLNQGNLPAKNGVRPHMFVSAQSTPAGAGDGGDDTSASTGDGGDDTSASTGDGGDDTSASTGDGGAEENTAAARDERPIPPPPGSGGAVVRLTQGQVVGGGVLSDKALERIACDATISRVLFGPDGHLLDLGRSTRVVSPAQWRALLLRDGGCVFPGHDCPAAYCEAHHLISWLDGGPTDLWNLAPVCTFGHTLVHERGYQLYLNEMNIWVLRKPDGTEILGLPLGKTRRGNITSIEVAMLNGPRGPCGD